MRRMPRLRAPALQARLRAMVAAGDDGRHRDHLARARPRSSRSIAYDVAILTSLTHEHLELHGTWEVSRLQLPVPGAAGGPARLRATSRGRKPGIVNLDDPSAGAFIGVTQEAGARVLTYGTDPAADVGATTSRRTGNDCGSPTMHLWRREPWAPAGGAVQRPQRPGRRHAR